MIQLPAISFSRLEKPGSGAVAFIMDENGELGPIARELDRGGRLARAISLANFKGKAGSAVDLLAPDGDFDRFIVVGCGKLEEAGEADWMRVGGKASAVADGAQTLTIISETAHGPLPPEAACAIAQGVKLGGYKFDRYKTRRNSGKNGEEQEDKQPASVVVAADDAASVRKLWKGGDKVADGVVFARDLVNEPSNVLGTVEFAERAGKLAKLGVDVEILDEKAMRKLKMGALLGVAQGSERPPRLVVMRWNGGKGDTPPVAFVGKGVVFDSGGLSIKPASGMEDMKGDMGGAAAVAGLMHALAGRKAKANAVGIIALVENMPDGKAQRPGDIVTSMSGQTIEVLNTDAEGRLVLADALWYCQDRFKPRYMINLATLTGAIIVALGHQHAGLFSNNDELAAWLADAGEKTGEKVWRMPLAREYDKLIDSKNADVKNIGGRWAGAITAAQFLQRFVNDCPWAHLDVAGTAMDSPKNEYSGSWASGFGVRLLDRLIADHFEK